jgi:hypothetical protein
MHPNAFTRSPGRRKATTKPEAASVPFRAADHLRNTKEITGYIRAMLADGDALTVLIALRTAGPIRSAGSPVRRTERPGDTYCP